MPRPRGRPPSAKTLVDRQLGRNVKHPVLPAGDTYQIPNLSEIRKGNEVWNFRGKVGIGTTTPIEALDVVGGNVRADKLILSRGGIGIQEPHIERTGNKAMGLFTLGLERMTISEGGNIDFKAGSLTTTGNVFLGAGNITTSGQINLTGASTNIITATNANGDLRLGAGGGTNDLKIDKDGNVDIFENLTLSGALLGGGAGHDQFSDFVANEHIDWTSTSSNFLTTGTVNTGLLTAQGSATTSVSIAEFDNSNAAVKARIQLDSAGAGEFELLDQSNVLNVHIDSNGLSFFKGGDVEFTGDLLDNTIAFTLNQDSVNGLKLGSGTTTTLSAVGSTRARLHLNDTGGSVNSRIMEIVMAGDVSTWRRRLDTGSATTMLSFNHTTSAATFTDDVDVGGYLGLQITDSDSSVEGDVWYDASEDKLKFRTAAGVETITSA